MYRMIHYLNGAQLQHALIYLRHKEDIGVIQAMRTTTSHHGSIPTVYVTAFGTNERLWLGVLERELLRIFHKFENHYSVGTPEEVKFFSTELHQ